MANVAEVISTAAVLIGVKVPLYLSTPSIVLNFTTVMRVAVVIMEIMESTEFVATE